MLLLVAVLPVYAIIGGDAACMESAGAFYS